MGRSCPYNHSLDIGAGTLVQTNKSLGHILVCSYCHGLGHKSKWCSVRLASGHYEASEEESETDGEEQTDYVDVLVHAVAQDTRHVQDPRHSYDADGNIMIGHSPASLQPLAKTVSNSESLRRAVSNEKLEALGFLDEGILQNLFREFNPNQAAAAAKARSFEGEQGAGISGTPSNDDTDPGSRGQRGSRRVSPSGVREASASQSGFLSPLHSQQSMKQMLGSHRQAEMSAAKSHDAPCREALLAESPPEASPRESLLEPGPVQSLQRGGLRRSGSLGDLYQGPARPAPWSTRQARSGMSAWNSRKSRQFKVHVNTEEGCREGEEASSLPASPFQRSPELPTVERSQSVCISLPASPFQRSPESHTVGVRHFQPGAIGRSKASAIDSASPFMDSPTYGAKQLLQPGAIRPSASMENLRKDLPVPRSTREARGRTSWIERTQYILKGDPEPAVSSPDETVWG